MGVNARDGVAYTRVAPKVLNACVRYTTLQ